MLNFKIMNLILLISGFLLLSVYTFLINMHFSKIEKVVKSSLTNEEPTSKFNYDLFFGFFVFGVLLYYFKPIITDIKFVPYKKNNESIFELCESDDFESKKLGLFFLKKKYPSLIKRYKNLLNWIDDEDQPESA